MQFIFLTISSFAAVEFFSYTAHRFLFHGILWKIHRTHHEPQLGAFELNDIFSAFFALCSIFLMVFAEKPFADSIAFPLGLGISIYGFVYFIVHDFFTHRRFFPFKSESKLLLKIRAAHQRHHQTIRKIGIEPFGLFVFDYEKFGEKSSKSKTKNAEAKII